MKTLQKERTAKRFYILSENGKERIFTFYQYNESITIKETLSETGKSWNKPMLLNIDNEMSYACSTADKKLYFCYNILKESYFYEKIIF